MRRFALLPALLFCLTLPASASPPPELGEPREPGELGIGGLLFRTEDGLREAPTLATDVSITVNGLIARTRVTQRFTNPTQDWVEGVYVFPLPEDSAVDSLEMRVGDRLIRGHVEERARARATYAKARSEGRKASLVEQERPNVFTTAIANLGPGEEVEVILGYQEDVRYDQGRFGLRFPMVVAPRYIPGRTRVEGFAGTGWSHNTDEVSDAARITPPVASPASGRRHPVTLRARIDAGFPLEAVESASHPILVRAEADHVYTVQLDARSVPANADFQLDWRPVVGATPGAALFHEEWEGEDYALLMVLPPSAAPDRMLDAASGAASRAGVSRETIIVIDTSGSMGGESILQARRAVDFALERLRPEDAFNVIRFDSSHRALFPASRPATAAAVAEAREWVGGLVADGGTQMLPALEAALAQGPESRAVRQVIFVTDGAVGNEAALFEAIDRRLDRSRLFTVGIGSAPNSHFMSKAARLGRGTFSYIGRPEEVAEKMAELFGKLESPVLHDLALEWDVDGVEAWPSRIPDVYQGEPVVVAARLPEGARRVVLRGRREGQDVQIELPVRGGSEHAGVARLWARRKVASLMDSLQEGASSDRVSVDVAALGVRHQLVTRWSSLVAVDVTPSAPVDADLETRAVPSLLPRGWDFSKLFGGGRSDQRLAPGTPAPPVAIDQPMAQVRIGRLPQGGTPAGLLVWLGTAMLGGAGIAWRLRPRVAPAAASAAAPVAGDEPTRRLAGTGRRA